LNKTYTNSEQMLKAYDFGTVSDVIRDYRQHNETKEVAIESLVD